VVTWLCSPIKGFELTRKS